MDSWKKIEEAVPGDAVAAYGGELGIVIPGRTPSRVPVVARGKVLVQTMSDVRKGEQATEVAQGQVAGVEHEPNGTPAQAWWMEALSRYQVGRLKVGEPLTAEEMAEG